jgi:hypothetical protein
MFRDNDVTVGAKLIFAALLTGAFTSFAVVGYLVFMAETPVNEVRFGDGIPVVRADPSPSKLPPPG